MTTRKLEAETYYDAFMINGELYVLNPKENGKVQCITAETPTGEKLTEILNAISQCRKKRKEWLEIEMTKLEKMQSLIDEFSSTTISTVQSTLGTFTKLKKDMYYGGFWF